MEDGTDAVLDVEEEVVDEALDVVGAVRGRKGAEADGKEPDVEVGHCEPGLEGRW